MQHKIPQKSHIKITDKSDNIMHCKYRLISLKSLIFKYLQDRVWLQQAVTKCCHMIISGAGDSVVEEDLLGGLCFTCSTFAWYEYTLVFSLGPHGPVSVVWQGIAEEKTKMQVQLQINMQVKHSSGIKSHKNQRRSRKPKANTERLLFHLQ